ncbi:MAG: hypothetical protein HOV66_15390 [Streptomycetaceae bacterium]|nr:hypothetical protein [Streptomycetaceae bacterium]
MTAIEPYQRAEVAQFDPTGGRLVAWAGAASAAHQLATSLSRTSFVPKAFQGNAADATAAIMLGDELGLSPIAALRSIYILSGTPALYARTMVALAMSHGHEIWTEESSDRQVTVCGRRRGQEHIERATWTIDRARKAGYTNNKKYDTDPQAMLYSKAAAEIARKIAPDVLSGVPYSVEDLELDEPEPTTPVARAPKTVQRRSKPVAVSPPEPDFDEPEQPAQEPVKATAERAPEPITPKQLTALNAALTSDLELTDREDKLAYLSGALGREISSSKDVTKAEAMRLLDQIARDTHESQPEEPPFDEGGDQ